MSALRVLSGFVAVTVLCVGCSSTDTEPAADPASSTSFPYVVDAVDPGAGFVELDGNRYSFDGVICADGAAESDPEGTTRVFGVYANFEVDDALAGVELTRYHNEIHDKMDTIPTVTEVAGVRMQSDDELLGLEAKRFQVVGQRDWQDPNDPGVTTSLITVDGDRYEVDALFSGVGDGDGDVGGTPGLIVARCPADSPTASTTD